ncbi:MAG TPA: PEP-CTERM sorting domain-containing protein [Phycisphaerae bacterium]|nr:PEP-CTERM sorting domain-containing protein [Phycisphaerae bacterium]
MVNSWSGAKRVVVGVGIVLLVGVSAWGGPAMGPLVSDPNAMPAWQGTQGFYDVSSGMTLDVDVEYAVYAPGNYGLSGTDPSGGAHYVYAYQVFNDLAGDAPVSSFSVGLDPTANASNLGSDAGSGTMPVGTAPTTSAFSGSPATSAVWYFSSNTIDPPPTNEYSTVLLFTSPYGPKWAPASLLDSGLSDRQDLPSPMPEPATAMLLLVGVAASLFARRHRRA